MSRRNGLALAVFFIAFAAYLATMPPSLPAYRDAGEMAASAFTLGVSHPPSYPLYIALGHLFQRFPLATPAWRLTLLSALSAAGAAAALFWVLVELAGTIPAFLGVAVFSTNIIFWSVAVVPEMYSLMLLMVLILLARALRLRADFQLRHWYLLGFLYGVFLGNRTDIVLCAPGILWISLNELREIRDRKLWQWAVAPLFLSLLGFSIYLYLPVRSMQNPWLDWNHPAELQRFINSLTRRSYGGTLDLLSKSYATGENFGANLLVYGRHLWKEYLGIWIALIPFGIFASFEKDRCVGAGLAAVYFIAGPLFLFLANMPPNPHALAIVDPHYLLSDAILAIWVAMGAAWAAERSNVSQMALGIAVLFVAFAPAAAGFGFLGRGDFWRRVDKRWDLMDYDFSHNTMRSLPPNAVLIAKKDVQLFSLWYFQTVEGLRPDVHLVAQGLSGSPWYQASRRRQGETAYVGPLRDASEWREFASLNGPNTFAGMDSEFPGDLALGPALGIVARVGPAEADETPWSFMVRRGDYHYEGQPAFFNSDLVDMYAQSQLRLGSYYIHHGWHERGIRRVLDALSQHWVLPEAAVYLGFANAEMRQFAEAAAAYSAAELLFDRSLEMAEDYHALPGVADNIRRGKAEALVNQGVVLERLNRPAEARAKYQEAISAAPNYAQAHYNLAVSYWNRDWRAAAREMQEVLRIEPANADAAKFLFAAQQRVKVGK